MFRNPMLDALKTKEQDAFRLKQAAYQSYNNAKYRASKAYTIMQSAWEARCFARERMNHEYEIMVAANEYYRETWGEYEKIRNRNSARIDSLRREADQEHKAMKTCFDLASEVYNSGHKSEAPQYSAEGHEHKKRRDELNAEISALVQEIRDAKESAKFHAPKTDSSSFHEAKERFNEAKSRHEFAQAEFKRLKAERDRYKAEFDKAQAEHTRLREEFYIKLEEIRTA